MQIVGQSCAQCHSKLVAEIDGVGCPPCEAVFHYDCLRDRETCPECSVPFSETKAQVVRQRAEAMGSNDEGGAFAPEKAGLRAGVLGGLLMMLIAVVWFVGGYAAGYIFYYPPILFLIGVYALIKGLATGNVSRQH